MLFLCNPYHQVLAIKDIVSFCLFLIVKYIILQQFSVKSLMVTYTSLQLQFISQDLLGFHSPLDFHSSVSEVHYNNHYRHGKWSERSL